MSITVIVALELRSAEEIAEIVGPRWKRVEVPGDRLTRESARRARTLAYGYTKAVVVAHGWRNAWKVGGGRKNRGKEALVWSAKRTRGLFDNSKEVT